MQSPLLQKVFNAVERPLPYLEKIFNPARTRTTTEELPGKIKELLLVRSRSNRLLAFITID